MKGSFKPYCPALKMAGLAGQLAGWLALALAGWLALAGASWATLAAWLVDLTVWLAE